MMTTSRLIERLFMLPLIGLTDLRRATMQEVYRVVAGGLPEMLQATPGDL